MKKIIAFGASNSKQSINKQLATYTAHQLKNVAVNVLDLNDFQLPLFGVDHENEHGIPDAAHAFLKRIKESDGIIISFAEHNGAYSTAFKNLFDWMSRIDNKLWGNIPMFLMATSPGARGGTSVLDIAMGRFPFMGGNIKAVFSLPHFHDNFSDNGIKDSDLAKNLEAEISKFQDVLNK